ncbi:MAG: bifunctional biotin--[acetyl-CoA-carboxylase] ligase/biotin operon repressor BirA [Pseudomonadota bacterium]
MSISADLARSKIIKALSSGDFVSGQRMADDLGLSRSSIANHVKELSKLGLDIYRVTGKGYKLSSPIVMINKDLIQDRLSINKLNSKQIDVLNVVGSTNDEIKRNLTNLDKGAVCIAEAQTKGRGRRGRKWVSPYGASIYLSMLWRFERGYESISGLSLAVGLAVKRAISAIGYDNVNLKWPNDIYAQNRKLAGILIELEGQLDGMTEVIIGIGINANLPQVELSIDQDYIDLQSLLNYTVDRNHVCAALIDELWSILVEFERSGISPLTNEWLEADLYRNKNVVLMAGKQSITGICRGIDDSGALLIETASGLRTFHGGEVSVRSDKNHAS